jgi:putative ABC transport system permease protein
LIDPAFFLRHNLGEMDLRVAVIAAIGGLSLALLAGMWPGLRATAFGLEQVLRDSRRSGVTGSPLDGLLGRLVAGATAATVMLMICAVLLGLSARDKMNELNPEAGTLTSELILEGHRPTRDQVELARSTLARLRVLPGVWRAALGSANSISLLTSLSGEPNRRMGGIEVTPVSEGYFETRGIRLLRGRGFSAREARDSGGTVVVSRALVQRLFPGQNGVGERFRYRSFNDSVIVDAQVIGVVENTESGNGMQLYLPLGSRPILSTSAFVQYKRGWPPQPGDVAKTLRSTQGISATTVMTMADKFRRDNPVGHYISFGFGMFAVVGLVLAIVGTYGVVTYSVVRRTHEIGVRMALGAESATVARMVIEHGVKITLVGVAIGGLMSIGVMRVLGALVQDVNMSYPAAIGGVICFVCLLSIIASAIPAFRAGRLNPVDALRAE